MWNVPLRHADMVSVCATQRWSRLWQYHSGSTTINQFWPSSTFRKLLTGCTMAQPPEMLPHNSSATGSGLDLGCCVRGVWTSSPWLHQFSPATQFPATSQYETACLQENLVKKASLSMTTETTPIHRQQNSMPARQGDWSSTAGLQLKKSFAE